MTQKCISSITKNVYLSEYLSISMIAQVYYHQKHEIILQTHCVFRLLDAVPVSACVAYLTLRALH